MKKIFCLLFVLFSAIGIFAQEKSIEKEEFEAARRNSYVGLAGRSFRETMTIETTSNAKNPSKYSSKSVMEFTPARATRRVSEVDSPTLRKKTETIRIEGKIYSRTDDGEWTVGKFEIRPAPERDFVPPARERIKTIDEQIEYKLLDPEVLDDSKTNVYAKIERKRLLDESNNKESSSIVTTKFWFAEDGRIMKQETIIENRFKPLNENEKESVYRHIRTSVWEIDPNIRIEAPMIDQR
jgi:hypothetical protein